MVQEYKPGSPKISGELELFMCLHAMDSAFDRIQRALNFLNARLVLRPESVHAKSAAAEALQAEINQELRETLGDVNLENFHQFSKNVRRSEMQLIDECLDLAYSPNATETDA